MAKGVKKENQQTQKCLKCGKQQPINKYIEFSQWCSPCRSKHIKTSDELEDFCNQFYIPFNVDVWNLSIEKFPDNEKKAIGKYFSLMNMHQNKSGSNRTASENKKQDDEEIPNYLIQKWGRNKEYTLEDYLFLEDEYTKWITGYESDSYSQQLLYKQISYETLGIKKEREEGKNVDKKLKSLQELMGSANLKPVQETGANALEQTSFGVLIKKWEDEKPIPEPLDEFKDVDGIKKYVDVWFLGHFCKMLNLKNAYSDLYEEELAKYTVTSPSEDDFVSGGDDE